MTYSHTTLGIIASVTCNDRTGWIFVFHVLHNPSVKCYHTVMITYNMAEFGEYVQHGISNCVRSSYNQCYTQHTGG